VGLLLFQRDSECCAARGAPGAAVPVAAAAVACARVCTAGARARAATGGGREGLLLRLVLRVPQPDAACAAATAAVREVFCCARGCLFFSALPRAVPLLSAMLLLVIQS
jgi:hypothetical protein